jgi:replicative DNA helicase
MIESTIISNLLFNEDYTRKVIPYLKEDYFEEINSKVIFSTFSKFFSEYNKLPSKEAMLVSLDNRRDLNEETFKNLSAEIKELKFDKTTDQQWLLDQTEKFCQDRDLYKAIRQSISILDGKEKELDKGSIPKLLSESLSISFDNRIGHNYISDADERFDYYHREETRIPFDIEMLNTITQGGLPIKSLTCFLGGTGSGKSLVMCHCAAANYMHGKNVLYITLELSEEEIGRRIDANLLDIPVSNIKDMSKDEFDRKISRVKSKTLGSLTIKEYPTGSMNANHLRHVLNEIKTKQGIDIDIIYLDYINLCSSFRIRNTNANSYTIVKSIAEEMRGLAMEFSLPIVTATQTGRDGINNSDVDIKDTSECICVNEHITLRNGDKIEIGNIKPGDQIIANDEFKTVSLVHHKKIKKCYKLTLKSGKTITVSADHIFPTKAGRKSINTGLKIGDILKSK